MPGERYKESSFQYIVLKCAAVGCSFTQKHHLNLKNGHLKFNSKQFFFTFSYRVTQQM